MKKPEDAANAIASEKLAMIVVDLRSDLNLCCVDNEAGPERA